MTTERTSLPSNSDKNVSGAFEKFSESVKRWIWQRGWSELHEVQERAASPILSGNKDVIIAAPTAGGKTEAAFLPIFSKIEATSKDDFGCLCVSPLKALINDQFRRLDEICECVGVAIHRWHGDVPSSQKTKFINKPSGVLLITPESLEAIFVLHGSRVSDLFKDLSYIVIDELHSFIGTERGRQLQSLLHRVELAIRRQVPRVALSATLGDMAIAAEFLRRGGNNVEIISSRGTGQELKLQIRGYKEKPPHADGLSEVPEQRATAEAEDESGDIHEICQHLFRTLRGDDNLVFANRRSTVEQVSDMLRRYSERLRIPNEFLPHHGSLSKEIREEAEAKLKDPSSPATVICTSTLEMGIDVGEMASIAQIGCPPSVASMKQRLGRSGRRAGKPAVMRIYISEPELTALTPLQDRLRAELVQSIAMVQLLIENWVEPSGADEIDFSTLFQQLLSVIAQFGGVKAAEAWKTLCQHGPFRNIDASTFEHFLRTLGEKQLIQQMHEGTLVLGPLGERIVNHYTFYTAFQTPEEYRLVANGKVLGSLPVTSIVTKGTFMIFAGQRWKVIAVDPETKTIHLESAPGGKVPKFLGSGALVHQKIREQMYEVFCSMEVPLFLDKNAEKLLKEGRESFREAGLQSKFLVETSEGTLFFPWAGDRVLNTLQLILLKNGFSASNEGIALFVLDSDRRDLLTLFEELIENDPPHPQDLALQTERLEFRKYDRFFDDELLKIDYASRALDCSGAWEKLSETVQRKNGS